MVEVMVTLILFWVAWPLCVGNSTVWYCMHKKEKNYKIEKENGPEQKKSVSLKCQRPTKCVPLPLSYY